MDGLKQDVCVDEPVPLVPAARMRAVVWRGAAISVHPVGAASYFRNSTSTTQAPCSPPRAYARTPHLSSGSPAIPPQFKASVPVSMARYEPVGSYELKERYP